jgi:transposase InsO family protein
MSRARLVITAVTAEGLSQGEAARRYGVSQGWVSKLLARYRAEGEAAFEPRSRRPGTSPNATAPGVVELIVALRKELAGQGLDAGPQTIAWHLRHRRLITVSAATISRTLTRQGLVAPEPAKRPRSSYVRFAAGMPNECRQAGFTHWRLAGGRDTEILTWLDDHSRCALSVTAHRRVTGPAVLRAFRAACARHGTPASTLTDHGMVFTTRFSGGKGGRNALENELRRLGVTQKNGKPNHPQAQGKAGRFQQTVKNWLARQPPAAALAELQGQLDAFAAVCNEKRPHRSLPHRAVPAAYARPGPRPPRATAPPAPTTASATTPPTPTAPSPCATAASSTASASAAPAPGPASSCSSRT